MDENDPAWKLAMAAYRGSMDQFDGDIRELKPSAESIARAYALCLKSAPFNQSEAPRLILREYLQLKLMQEHVAEQERMGRTINVLTVVLVVLTAALTLFAYEEHQEHRSEASVVLSPDPGLGPG